MTLPVLYLLMRNDLDSMNSGKAIAQGSHASNAFVFAYHEWMATASTNQTDKQTSTLHQAFNRWQNETVQGFGTVLVLEGSMTDIIDTFDDAVTAGYMADIIHDPTYPIVDGNVVHHIPLNTCAYMFVPDKLTDVTAAQILSKYNLHK